MSNEQDRSEELEVLESIFDTNQFTINANSEPVTGTFFATPVLPEDFKITCTSPGGISKIPIQYLPPMKLLFKLVPLYPSTSPPAFLLACQWLNLDQISRLCRKLEGIWLENQPQVVLYCWMQFLQEQALPFLEISNNLDLCVLSSVSQQVTEMYYSVPTTRSARSGSLVNPKTSPIHHYRQRKVFQAVCKTKGGEGQYDERAVMDLTNGAQLLPRIIEWNKKCKQEAFNKEWFNCKVCLSQKQGVDGYRFNDCNHIYCRNCMAEYFRVQIQEGNVQLLNCPETKCPSQAVPYQVRELVGSELYERYDKLLLDSALAKMIDVVNCPRQTCQCSSLVDNESKVGSCSQCQYHFCLLCKRAYHGLEPCRFKDEERSELMKKYLSGNAEEKLALEQRYGKKRLLEMIDESMSNDWIQLYSKRCPHCNASIEKSDGCNKMTCWRCNTLFCWLCGIRLSSKEPYTHYNSSKSKCFGFLFHGVETLSDDSDDDDIEFGEFLH